MVYTIKANDTLKSKSGKYYRSESNLKKESKKRNIKAREIIASFIMPRGQVEITSKILSIPINGLNKSKLPKEFDNRKSNRRNLRAKKRVISSLEKKSLSRLAKNLSFDTFKKHIIVDTFKIGNSKYYDLFNKKGSWINVTRAKNKDEAVKPFYNFFKKAK